MIKVFRFLAISTIAVAFATSSIAWAQTYTTVDYPGRDCHHSKRRARPTGHKRRQLDRHRRCNSWFHTFA